MNSPLAKSRVYSSCELCSCREGIITDISSLRGEGLRREQHKHRRKSKPDVLVMNKIPSPALITAQNSTGGLVYEAYYMHFFPPQEEFYFR